MFKHTISHHLLLIYGKFMKVSPLLSLGNGLVSRSLFLRQEQRPYSLVTPSPELRGTEVPLPCHRGFPTNPLVHIEKALGNARKTSIKWSEAMCGYPMHPKHATSAQMSTVHGRPQEPSEGTAEVKGLDVSHAKRKPYTQMLGTQPHHGANPSLSHPKTGQASGCHIPKSLALATCLCLVSAEGHEQQYHRGVP